MSARQRSRRSRPAAISVDGLPTWLDLDVPDDRFIASTLLLQSAHPGSKLDAATSDINLQTKLAAVGLPHVEGPAAT
ncbi:hypothetical protein [Streptomyces sp. NPDC006668]|uniref:hypothetical protein n=1 Tax=Streptomyces sp. NPDC006668 TaxID=3156903 RepID=UPI0033F3C659